MNTDAATTLERLLNRAEPTAKAAWQSLVAHYRVEAVVCVLLALCGLASVSLCWYIIAKKWDRLDDDYDLDRAVVVFVAGLLSLFFVIGCCCTLSASVPALFNPEGYAVAQALEAVK